MPTTIDGPPRVGRKSNEELTREAAIRELEAHGLLTRDPMGRLVATARGIEILARIQEQQKRGEDRYTALKSAFDQPEADSSMEEVDVDDRVGCAI